MAKFCTNCGAPLENGQTTCTSCGNVIGTQTANQSTNNANTGYNNTYAGGNRKSKVAAGVLGILLGALGVHNFYLGYVGKGIAQLLITVLTCGILSGVSAIWGLIEGILILTGSINIDANGVPLGD